MALFSSSTQTIPVTGEIPQHIAVIMDGNGRWAKKRFLPRVAGHKRGVEVVREMVRLCANNGVKFLTLFAFSSENWRRPADEVTFLMSLFMEALQQEVGKLAENNIRLVMIGDKSRFEPALTAKIAEAEAATANNDGLTLTIAANYGGRWDVMQALQRLIQDKPEAVQGFSEEELAAYLSMHYAPEPDLFIRTGGEQRISNFLLWQLAYSELYFTETLWPDFDEAEFKRAIASYQQRERRFGRTSEQLASN
ncbi:isoprenyl transferase [Methylobacillus glycogenes]|uniref:isoprenyl transferase n=1 Tax=Methylobacillus glycogenes TaxID=406 RepID=UPI000471C5F4|nr:isoprenyl transferase [Methylobacillus glycogenes]MBL8505961.1 isoprenyl transferase [Methylobacillus glycogenes]